MNNQKNNTSTQTSQSIIAIDVAKDSLQVRLADSSRLLLDNSPRGFATLLNRTKSTPSAFVVFEATGGYERPWRTSSTSTK